MLFLLYQLSEKYLYREHTPMLDLFLAQYALELNKKLYSIETATEVRFQILRFPNNFKIKFKIKYF
ncbi:unnamed protein product [Brugia timori]|uniref:Uncharacterized protein n=1 Tax=Brugia timori TaxID=42155 RepID=A0A3P7UBV1_9BILA|nr:unnamed protein product [Brugia timori]